MKKARKHFRQREDENKGPEAGVCLAQLKTRVERSLWLGRKGRGWNGSGG
jgi:hypothetical protein